MRGLMRMLMMFGPMLYGQYQKYQRNKAKSQTAQAPEKQVDREHEANKQENTDGNDSFV